MTIAAIPLDDWQFWVVTLVAALAIGLLARPFLPKRRGKSAACPGCPSGEAASKPPRSKHVDLTIGGRRVKS